MAWRQEEFIHNRLWEQRAVIHLLFAYDLSEHVRIVPERRMNSDPSNYLPGDFLLHIPDRPRWTSRLDALRSHAQLEMP